MNSDNFELFLAVVPALAVIIAVSRLCGRLALYVGQPRVVGEMCAGVLLGPSLLGLVAPSVQEALFTSEVKSVLYVLSNIGLTFYMFLVGMETDRKLLTRKYVRQSAYLSMAGILPSFGLGVAVALPLYNTLSLPEVNPFEFSIFIGCALAMSAFPMLARILQEQGLTKSRIGSLTLGAAAVDDAAAWGLLAVIIAMAQARSTVSGLYAVAGGALFAAFVLLVVRRFLRPLGERTEASGSLSQGSLALVVLLVLTAGWFTDYIGVFSVFGGFIMGLAMPQTPVFQRGLRDRLLDFNVVFLLLIFFTYSGINTRLTGLTSVALLVPFLVILGASVLGKYGGCTVAAKAVGFSWREASAIGGLMNARGLMELIIINVGLTYGLISQDMFSMLALMAIVTTAAALPIYRYSLTDRREADSIQHQQNKKGEEEIVSQVSKART